MAVNRIKRWLHTVTATASAAGGRAGDASRRFTEPSGSAQLDSSMNSRPRRNPFVWGLLVTLGAGAGFAILVAITNLSTVLVYAGIALFLALALEPGVAWLNKRGVKRGLAAALVLLVTIAAVGQLLALLIPALIEQITGLIVAAPALALSISQAPWFDDAATAVSQYVDLDEMLNDATAFFTDPARLAAIGGGILSVGEKLTAGVSGLLAVTILTIYFTFGLPGIKRTLYRTVPASRRGRFIDIAEDIALSVGRYVAGQVALAAVNGIFVFLLLMISGGPAPVLLALIAFVGALIPVVGTVIAYAIIVTVTVIVSPVLALIVGLILLAYAQVEAYVLTPRVMAQAVSIPGSLVILAALGGAALGGVLGALVAVPIAASGVLIFNRIIVPRQESR